MIRLWLFGALAALAVIGGLAVAVVEHERKARLRVVFRQDREGAHG